jgi:formate/nitrite transporter FocA (FNT family)
VSAQRKSDGPRPAFAPGLKEGESAEAEEKSEVSASVVHEAIRREGEEELERPTAALAWSGLAAGLSMGFSFVAEALLRARLPDAPWRPLISKLGYTLGFVIVVLGRQQLFTENTLTPILPLLSNRTLETLKNVARLWTVVLLANLLGGLLFALAAEHTSAFQPEVHRAFTEIGRESLEGSFGGILVKGIFAGWLIALMVWLLPHAETARVWVIILLTYAVGLGGFAHVVAGASEVFYLAWAGQTSWGAAWGGFLLPTLIGNIIGGVMLVAALNHAQVVSGDSETGNRQDG